jgi:hypothetical protein
MDRQEMVETLHLLCKDNDIEFDRLLDAIILEFLSDSDFMEATLDQLKAEEDEADYYCNRGVVDGRD